MECYSSATFCYPNLRIQFQTTALDYIKDAVLNSRDEIKKTFKQTHI